MNNLSNEYLIEHHLPMKLFSLEKKQFNQLINKIFNPKITAY